MQWFRIANLVMQSAYLLGHLLFLRFMFQRRQSSPVWVLFFAVTACLWLWVSGRFMETIVYLFFPHSNDAYVFAANFQYIGNTTAVATYDLWILYLSGRRKLARDPRLRAALFACPLTVCALVFTNPLHHLFYTKLVMGQRVEHGPAFLPCLMWGFLLLAAGYVTSLRHVIRTGRDTVKQAVMFSLFPLAPAVGTLARSISGMDQLDTTPLLMSVAVFSLYQIVFRYRYVNIVSASVRSVLEQSAHPIAIFGGPGDAPVYANRIARREWEGGAAGAALPSAPPAGRFEQDVGGKRMIVDVKPLSRAGYTMVTGTDISLLHSEQLALELQIDRLTELRRELEDTNRNLDAYLGSLGGVRDASEVQKLAEDTRRMARHTLDRVGENLDRARRDPDGAERALKDNLRLTKQCMDDIRSTVLQLKEA